ncbi:hypothetical protein SARC_06139 [Sphaeroforma arctica JP610]|uniref:protein disulfide-isomerase n=1 Tax=Sphaeroforma arctica JP610 TaxID=667725 RepID=A0A0L0FY38_9EUKA|nr:hypothetical protein SARC_06139 [Sphaeroforma arctica JP610]KNC81549.1 hypothetical protein SARC_06139 [Sphaeroforma arctica JP610]|eukprot:XP_014155451.1 hypothetical protein SARC_06139 [Sphaeroforma arctica JP610]
MKVSFATSLGLLAAIGNVCAFYESGSSVVSLTESNFDAKVIKSDSVVLVEFYAPWCGHCKNLTPEYEKTAKMLKGVARVAAVDADQYKSLGQKYDVQGFPTIKLFGADKQKPTDYNQARDAASMAKAVLKEVNTVVKDRIGGKSSSSGGSKSGSKGSGGGAAGKPVQLTDANFEETVMKSSDTWLVEFMAPWCGHCKNLEPQWRQAAAELKNTPNVKLGVVDATVEQQIAGRYQIKGYPTIKVFGKNKSKPSDYNGPREADGIVAYAKDLAIRAAPAPKVYELTDAKIWEEQCGGKSICVVTVLPHILDSSANERNEYIKMLKQAAKALKSQPFKWLWTEPGKQADLEERLNIGGAGYPAVAAVSLSKEKYSNMRMAVDLEHVKSFLNNLMTGKEHLGPLRQVPTIAIADAWDGKDGELPREEL